MKKQQTLIGIGLFLIAVIFIYFAVPKVSLFYRFLIGFGFGLALVKSSLGFAGSVNKLSWQGSSSVAQTLMIMFVLTAIFMSFLLYGHEGDYKLNIYPINMGLLVGGLLFGFGMALSGCCATGSLTGIANSFSRGAVTVLFFGMGVFLGYKPQKTFSWVTDSWFTSPTGAESKGGIFIPDLFDFGGVSGYLFAILFTAVLAYIVFVLAKKQEKKLGIIDVNRDESFKLLSLKEIITKPWNLKTSAIIVAVLFVLLTLVSGKGWGATTAFGFWFAKLLMIFGVSVEAISEFTGKSEAWFSKSILEYSGSIQNIGIVLGAFVTLFLNQIFDRKFIAGLKITPTAFVLFAIGGFIMGFGTRLSNGCNVGALYTPIAEFSLSGWLYLIVIAIGGFAGNSFIRKYVSSTCSF